MWPVLVGGSAAPGECRVGGGERRVRLVRADLTARMAVMERRRRWVLSTFKWRAGPYAGGGEEGACSLSGGGGERWELGAARVRGAGEVRELLSGRACSFVRV